MAQVRVVGPGAGAGAQARLGARANRDGDAGDRRPGRCRGHGPAGHKAGGHTGALAVGSASLNRKARKILDRDVLSALADGSQRAIIVGHADAHGTSRRNQRLARRRADAVRDYLEDAGVDPALLVMESGEASLPVASNRTRAGRKSNRRVEIFITR